MQAGRDTPVEQVVARMVAELARPEGERRIRDARLADLGLDSLACAELAIAMEERFAVSLVDGDFSDLTTVGDVAATVRRAMAPGPRIRRGFGGFQATAKSIASGPIRWYCRLEVIGLGNIPATGPAILAANHRSMWDIPVHVVACPRPVLFMAKRELFGDPVRRWMWHILGGFAVRRDIADVRAIDTALALLERGDIVGVYPEGTRSKTGEMLPFLRGAAWLALRTGAPLIPCGLSGTGVGGTGVGQHLRRKRVRVSFGRAIRVGPEPNATARKEKAESLTGELLEGIRALLA